MECDEPVLTADAAAHNYTNEGSFGGRIRLLKNIIGLWLMQECRRQWAREGEEMAFSDIDKLTVLAEPLRCFIDPDYEAFSAPGNMPARIADYCKQTGQKLPEGKGGFARCITESLALKYREAVEGLESVLGRRFDVLRIIGGGVKDKLLCQFPANAIGRPVLAGPIEATALGNLTVLLFALGERSGIDEARALVGGSLPPIVYEPQDTALWDDAYDRFRRCKL